MDLEDALNLGLPPHDVELCTDGEETVYRAEIRDYPQCTGLGPTPEDAVRVARHLYSQLRDSQAAVNVSNLERERSERMREAIRLVVTRALV